MICKQIVCRQYFFNKPELICLHMVSSIANTNNSKWFQVLLTLILYEKKSFYVSSAIEK